MWKILNGRDWLGGNLGLIMMDGTMLSKSLIQFSADGWGYGPFLLFGLRLNYGRGTHSSVLAWRIPGTGEPGGLPSMGSRRVGHD